MNLTFLGGGNEIGASSAIVEIGSARILVDCGIRMSGDHRLPDLAFIRFSTSWTKSGRSLRPPSASVCWRVTPA
jgi:predicted metal-dependent RNase